MRIAMVTESFLPVVNGVTTSVCRVAECLRARGHEVVIVAPEHGAVRNSVGPGAGRASGTAQDVAAAPVLPAVRALVRSAGAPDWFEDVPVHRVRSVPIRQFPTGLPSGRVGSLLAEIAPDVVHIASPFVLGARALVACRDLGLPSVAIYQTDMPRYVAQHAPGPLGPRAARAAWRWVAWMHEHADVTLAPSAASAAALWAHGIPRVALWGRGVDTAAFSPIAALEPAAVALRAELAPDGEAVVGYVGRLAPEKELDRLAEVAALPGARLVLIGDGPSRAFLEDGLGRAAALVGAQAPVFLGFRTGPDLVAAYGALDIFVHPGTTETFGQTLQEAAACGLPVVAAAVGGPLDLVQHGVTGYLVDPDRPGALSASVGELVADPRLRRGLGAAGAQAVAGRSWAALTTELEGHYRAVRAARVAG